MNISKKQLAFLSLFFLGCIAILGLSIILRNNRTIPEWNGQICNIENVNALDAAAAHPYSKSIDDAGTYAFIFCHAVLLISCFLIPGISYLKNRKNLLPLFLDFGFYLESCGYAFGIYRILKTAGGRLRPYMYFPDPSLKGIAEGDFISSWPSGHSSMAFLAVGFLFAILKYKDFKPATKKALLAAVLVIAVLTLVLRIFSGNHFPTDVLTGAALGFTVSCAVVCINKKILSEN